MKPQLIVSKFWLIAICGCLELHGQGPGLPIHSFEVRETGGKTLQLQTGDNRLTIVVFVSGLCPISTDYAPRLTKLNQGYRGRGVRMLLVNSNQNESDSQVEAQRNLSKLAMPVYRDPLGQLADRLGATATPSAVMLDHTGQIRYSGAIDDSRNAARVTKPYLQLAIEEVLGGKPVTLARTPARGCSIKSSIP
jgi:hypothetical protein